MEVFRPDVYQKSIYDIDYMKLKNNGIRCLLFDLDNTLAPIDITVPDKKLQDFFHYLEEIGLKAIILSNASKKRVTPFKEKCNIDSSYHSHKPFKKKYKRILEIYHFKDTEVACVGDQLLTDVFGANRLGFTSILVNPISKNDHLPTKINRFLENRIYHSLKRKGLFERGIYYE